MTRVVSRDDSADSFAGRQCLLWEVRQKAVLSSSIDIAIRIFLQERIRNPAFSNAKSESKKKAKIKI